LTPDVDEPDEAYASYLEDCSRVLTRAREYASGRPDWNLFAVNRADRGDVPHPQVAYDTVIHTGDCPRAIMPDESWTAQDVADSQPIFAELITLEVGCAWLASNGMAARPDCKPQLGPTRRPAQAEVGDRDRHAAVEGQERSGTVLSRVQRRLAACRCRVRRGRNRTSSPLHRQATGTRHGVTFAR
jgi:hypothetical protein